MLQSSTDWPGYMETLACKNRFYTTLEMSPDPPKANVSHSDPVDLQPCRTRRVCR